MQETLENLSGVGSDWVETDERRIKDVISSTIRLRTRNLRKWLTDLQYLESVAKDKNDLEQAKSYQDFILKYTRAMRGLQKLLRNYSDPLILSDTE